MEKVNLDELKQTLKEISSRVTEYETITESVKLSSLVKGKDLDELTDIFTSWMEQYLELSRILADFKEVVDSDKLALDYHKTLEANKEEVINEFKGVQTKINSHVKLKFMEEDTILKLIEIQFTKLKTFEDFYRRAVRTIEANLAGKRYRES